MAPKAKALKAKPSVRSKPSTKSSTGDKVSKPKHNKAKTQHKSKQATASVKKRKKVYSDKELGITELNMITPAGVQKPKGKKKGKIFADDQESMMTIVALVTAEKEGQLESKIMKARQMEAIREARKEELEARHEKKREQFEKTKDSLRTKHKRKLDSKEGVTEEVATVKSTENLKKRVSFG